MEKQTILYLVAESKTLSSISARDSGSSEVLNSHSQSCPEALIKPWETMIGCFLERAEDKYIILEFKKANKLTTSQSPVEGLTVSNSGSQLMLRTYDVTS